MFEQTFKNIDDVLWKEAGCSSELDYTKQSSWMLFLKYLLLAEGKGFFKYSSGSVHQTIYFPEVKAFHICCPTAEVQSRIVKYLDHARLKTERLQRLYAKKLTALAELKQSILQKAFAGELH